MRRTSTFHFGRKPRRASLASRSRWGGVASFGVLAGILVAGVVALGIATSAFAVVPEPEPVPRRWELDYKLGALRVTTVKLEGQEARAYFYMSYRVSNPSKEDVLFAPVFELSTSEGEMVRSGRDVPQDVTKAIIAKLDNPLLQDQISILGTLQTGEANAREGVVIWPLPRTELDSVSVYIAGLSGETRTVEVIDPSTKETKRVTLRKSRLLRFRMPVEVLNQGSEPFDLEEDRWILR